MAHGEGFGEMERGLGITDQDALAFERTARVYDAGRRITGSLMRPPTDPDDLNGMARLQPDPRGGLGGQALKLEGVPDPRLTHEFELAA